jgi:exopolyphosphatase/guanosine-5'-triphosphate,3'-diphosphate pyrophosphatase
VPELRGSDLRAVEEQLGREPATEFSVVARCPDGHPLVIRDHPVDREGNPFPTLYWLTCPRAVRAVSRLESEGWIRRLADRAREDADLATALERAHRAYAEERGRFHPDAREWGGVGGSRAGVKCLHAHYANHVAGGDDPVGAWVAERIEPVHGAADPGQRVAAVDMGTNSIRLIVAAASSGEGFVELARDLVITRLGRGVDRTGRLDPRALRRTIDVLERYVRRARGLGASRIRVAATSAVRDAGDRRLLEAEVTRVAGTSPEVLTGEQEARLSFEGATDGLDVPAPFLVFDIGGGSTELILGRGDPEAAASVDVGSVRITERVGPADPPTDLDVAAMSRLAREGLAPVTRRIEPGSARTLVGVAGTTTTVQAIALGLGRYDPDAIHRSVLTRDAAARVMDELAAMTTAERARLPVMTPGREDVIVAGCTILLEILDRWGFEACLVSERDILDGLALDMLRDRPGTGSG